MARYSSARIVLHWLSAAVIVWASITGFMAGLLPFGDPFRRTIDLVNPQLTTMFIPVFLWRGALFLSHSPWRGWSGMTTAARFAIAGHGLIYATIALVLATGYLMMPATWLFLGFLPPPRWGLASAQLGLAILLHHVFAFCLSMLVTGHLLAVVRHHRNGNPVLRRMLP